MPADVFSRHLHTLLAEHGQMVELLYDCACCMSPIFLRTKVKALLAKLDGEGGEADPEKADQAAICPECGNGARIAPCPTCCPKAEMAPITFQGILPPYYVATRTIVAGEVAKVGVELAESGRVPVPDPEPEQKMWIHGTFDPPLRFDQNDKLPAAPKVEVGDRKARRDRFMCALLASGDYRDADEDELASWAEKAIDASDALDAGGVRHDS